MVFIPYGQIILHVWLCICYTAGRTDSTYVSLQIPSAPLQVIVMVRFSFLVRVKEWASCLHHVGRL
jgi:hypothetical protein